MEITIPYSFKPRDYQLPILQAMDSGMRRACWVAHRRSGKDKTLWNLTIKKSVERVGTFYYLLPTYSQAKKIIWDGRDKEGFAFLDHIPPELLYQKHDTELKIRLRNGSLIQLVGTDNYDAIMGTNPIGCVFSEYSLQNPLAYQYISPILAENEGWAAFAYTPRGRNHGHTLYRMAQKNPDWFCELLTVDDTKAITEEAIETERRAGMAEELILQEFWCSFDAGIHGSYYWQQLRDARKEGRIRQVPHDKTLQVDTWWDLGIGDSTAIWFTQNVGNEIRLIDYYEAQGESLEYYVNVLKERGYTYGTHYMPHDVEVKELGTGRSRKEIAMSLGLRPITVIPKLPLEDGINAVRMLFGRMYFDEEKCGKGLEAIADYRKEWDEKRQEFKNRPFHDVFELSNVSGPRILHEGTHGTRCDIRKILVLIVSALFGFHSAHGSIKRD